MNGLPAAILEGGGKAVVSVEPECVDIYSQFLVNESKLSRSCNSLRIACGDPWRGGWNATTLKTSPSWVFCFLVKRG